MYIYIYIYVCIDMYMYTFRVQGLGCWVKDLGFLELRENNGESIAKVNRKAWKLGFSEPMGKTASIAPSTS